MSGFKVQTDDVGSTIKINQGIGDIKAGLRQGGDFSRISAYDGPSKGLHTGANSPTVGRGNTPFKK